MIKVTQQYIVKSSKHIGLQEYATSWTRSPAVFELVLLLIFTGNMHPTA